jgi:hypothetical protein
VAQQRDYESPRGWGVGLLESQLSTLIVGLLGRIAMLSVHEHEHILREEFGVHSPPELKALETALGRESTGSSLPVEGTLSCRKMGDGRRLFVIGPSSGTRNSISVVLAGLPHQGTGHGHRDISSTNLRRGARYQIH